MSPLALASAVLLTSLMGAPAHAGDRTPATAQPASAAPAPASADQRAAAERMDALTRSVFWSRERDLNPADPIAGVRLAVSLRELGQYDQAADAAQAVLTAQPDNYEAMLEFGRDQIARGQGFYGIAALEKAKAIAPGDWRPLSLLGVAYNQVRRADDARAAWNEGLQLSADNPEILTNAAVALMTDGNLPGAESLLRRAVVQPNATSKMRLNLALVLGLQGKTPEAEQIIRRDLPPEQADRNLQWLRDKSAPQMVAASLPGNASATARTWSSLQSQ